MYKNKRTKDIKKALDLSKLTLSGIRDRTLLSVCPKVQYWIIIYIKYIFKTINKIARYVDDIVIGFTAPNWKF